MCMHLVLYYIFSDIFWLCLSHRPGSTVQRITHDIWLNIFIKGCNSCFPQVKDIVVLDTNWTVQTLILYIYIYIYINNRILIIRELKCSELL